MSFTCIQNKSKRTKFRISASLSNLVSHRAKDCVRIPLSPFLKSFPISRPAVLSAWVTLHPSHFLIPPLRQPLLGETFLHCYIWRKSCPVQQFPLLYFSKSAMILFVGIFSQSISPENVSVVKAGTMSLLVTIAFTY